MDLKQTGWEGVEWIHDSRQGPILGSCDHSNGHYCSIQDKRDFLTSIVTTVFTRVLPPLFFAELYPQKHGWGGLHGTLMLLLHKKTVTIIVIHYK
jgi:hypothetical protein